MARFFPLTVTDIRRETRDAVAIILAPRPEDAEAFDFVQGQYLTFRKEIDGEELRRAYSICAGRGEPLRVGIKRVEGGAFSTWASENLAVGDTVEAMAPMGHFHAALEPARAKRYLGFAAGSGITPVLGIIRTVLAAEPQSHFTLVYGNRSIHSVMFREELEDLKNLNMGRFSVIHMLGGEGRDIELFSGRIDGEKCAALFKSWIDVASVDQAFLCGPEPMMLAVAAALREHGLNERQIKFELFASAQPGRAPRKPAATAKAKAGTARKATIRIDGESHAIEMAAGETVLAAAHRARIDAPYACKAGVCSTCRAMVVEGEAQMEINHALEDYEIRRGYVLTCQAIPVTPSIAVDYDE